MTEFLSHRPHCLAGRVTAVVSAKGYAHDGTSMVCKIYHPEVQRRHEGRTVQVIHRIAEEPNTDMHKHLPSVLFYADLPGCTTQRIRSVIKRGWKGDRTLRIIGLKKLNKITSVEGAAFIKAWLEAIGCHAFLWKHYVEHGDPSVTNLMYDPETKCGVLSDFDLSILQWEPRVFGTDRTGTVPFMANDLLEDGYWQGKIRRFFHHELESFIWILAYVSLVYDKGIRKRNAQVDAWTTSDYNVCRQKKSDFYKPRHLDGLAGQVQPTYQIYWPLIRTLCFGLAAYQGRNDQRYYTRRVELKHNSKNTASSDPAIPNFAVGPVVFDPCVDVASAFATESSEDLWNVFLTAFTSTNLDQDQDLLNISEILTCLRAQKPSFDPLTNDKKELRKQYHFVINGISQLG
ncbi:hypothetical protein BDN70DRAFT_833143 [Pholiota conissans]|uniref:Fungal-type protein kinase domain-containing protein n=1 Tax=Pholiota conissans TaxID=109636 RepID=A0A9P5Z4U1_9AGAR|nr:hypothetical protein BDN70DRAFT_833143 [Pholiota conissans]